MMMTVLRAVSTPLGLQAGDNALKVSLSSFLIYSIALHLRYIFYRADYGTSWTASLFRLYVQDLDHLM